MHFLPASGRWSRGGGILAAAVLAATGLTAVAGPVAAAGELPVFAVRQTGLDSQQAAALQKAFGLSRIERSADGAVEFLDTAKFLHVPTVAGGTGHADEDGPTRITRMDFAALGAMTALPPSVAVTRTEAALRNAGLTPDSASVAADHTTLEAVDTRGVPLVSANLDTTAFYSFRLAGLPYDGPGAKIRVAYAGDGAVTQLRYATRTLVPAGAVRVADLTTGAARCGRRLGSAARVKAEYAYYAPHLSTALTRLEPSFRCSGSSEDGSDLQVSYLPAAADAVLAPMPAPQPPRSTTPNPLIATAATQTASSSPAGSGVTVGSEGTGPCSGLEHTATNIASFNDAFSSRGIPVQFSWLDQAAWENDFKDPAFSGGDTVWADDVDMTYWQGHGYSNGFSFKNCSAIDDSKLHYNDARWGQNDVEWMSLFTCSVLKGEDGNGLKWWQRWGSAFHRLHQINSFHTVSYHSSKHGGIYGNYLLGGSPLKVRSAWAQASIDDQPSEVKWASMGALGAGGVTSIDDYFHGKGQISPDVTHAGLTGWWYLRGNS